MLNLLLEVYLFLEFLGLAGIWWLQSNLVPLHAADTGRPPGLAKPSADILRPALPLASSFLPLADVAITTLVHASFFIL